MTAGRKLNSSSLNRLLGDWRTNRAEGIAAALEHRMTLLIRDGRLPFGTRLPPERDFARELGISRTTIASVYDALRTTGQLESRQGSGSWVTSQGHAADEASTPWYPGGSNREIDLTQAALPAPENSLPHLVERAVQSVGRYANGHGYHLYGLPELREAIARRFSERGLPTHAGQILVTTGAQNALALGLAITIHSGSRVLADNPTYPNALSAIRQWGGRCVPVDLPSAGWRPQDWHDAAHQAQPDLFYCVPDFHNPTGLVMSQECRARLVEIARLCGSAMIVDETLAETAIDVEAPSPIAVHAREGAAMMTIGSLSKIYWGGLRVGWMRAPEALIAKAAAVKASLDMATPVFDQLLALGVFDELPAIMQKRKEHLRRNRDHLIGSLSAHIPEWKMAPPSGGLSAWIDLGVPVASRLADAARQESVAITPGTLFGSDGSFEDRIRIPFTLDATLTDEAIRRLARAWTSVRDNRPQTIRATATVAV